jgi:hypothetical protein
VEDTTTGAAAAAAALGAFTAFAALGASTTGAATGVAAAAAGFFATLVAVGFAEAGEAFIIPETEEEEEDILRGVMLTKQGVPGLNFVFSVPHFFMWNSKFAFTC